MHKWTRLEALSLAAAKAVQEQLGAYHSSPMYMIKLAGMIHRVDPHVREYINELRNVESIKEIESMRLWFGGSASDIQDHFIPLAVLRIVMEGRSLGEFMDEMEVFALSKSASLEWKGALVGIDVQDEIQLSDGVRLLPYSSLTTWEKMRFTEDGAGGFSARYAPMMAQPSSIVCIETEKKQVLYSKDEKADSVDALALGRHQKELETANLKAMDVAHCATMMTGRPVALVASWWCLSGFAPSMLSSIQSTWSDLLFDAAVVGLSFQSVKLKSDEISRIWNHFLKCDGAVKKRIRLAVERASRSLRNSNLIDKAIDIGIALETILLNDQEQNELKYRMSLRGAHYLGQTAKERREIFSVLGAAYIQRSSAVHNATLKVKPGGELEVTNTLARAGELAIEAAKKVVLSSGFPDWDELLVGSTE